MIFCIRRNKAFLKQRDESLGGILMMFMFVCTTCDSLSKQEHLLFRTQEIRVAK